MPLFAPAIADQIQDGDGRGSSRCVQRPLRTTGGFIHGVPCGIHDCPRPMYSRIRLSLRYSSVHSVFETLQIDVLLLIVAHVVAACTPNCTTKAFEQAIDKPHTPSSPYCCDRGDLAAQVLPPPCSILSHAPASLSVSATRHGFYCQELPTPPFPPPPPATPVDASDRPPLPPPSRAGAARCARRRQGASSASPPRAIGQWRPQA